MARLSGLVQKFPVDRPLMRHEKESFIDHANKLSCNPNSELRTIKINDAFLEMVDKFYMEKGEITCWLLIVGMTFLALGFLLLPFLFRPMGVGEWYSMLALTVFSFCSSACILLSLRIECFGYTHWPIRFSRVDRKVYFFRRNGSYREADWDSLYFYMEKEYQSPGIAGWELRCHILAEDRNTVLETFPLGDACQYPEGILDQLEFIRRYMDEGAASVVDDIEFVMPIDQKRERFRLGWELRWVNTHLALQKFFPIGIFLLFIDVFYCSARWLAIRTSKVPQWPEEVEDANPIDPGDPYIRDSSTNPEHVPF